MEPQRVRAWLPAATAAAGMLNDVALGGSERTMTEAARSSCPRFNSLGLDRAHQGLRRSSIKAVVDVDLQIYAQVCRHSLQRPSGERDMGKVKLRGGLCRRVVSLSPWFPLHTSRAHMKRAPVFVYGTPRPSRTHCSLVSDLCYSNHTTSTRKLDEKGAVVVRVVCAHRVQTLSRVLLR